MKKRAFSVAVLSAFLFFGAACQSDPVTVSQEEAEMPVPEVPTLSLRSDVATLSVTGYGTPKIGFTVRLSREAAEETAVGLTLETDCEAGEYEFPEKQLTIPAGQSEARGTVLLHPEKMPEEAEREITLRLQPGECAVSEENGAFTVNIHKPYLGRPGIVYPAPTVSYIGAAYCAAFSVGGIAFERGYEMRSYYEDLTDKRVASLVRGKNTVQILTDRAAANASFSDYDYTVQVWADWNGDGDFADSGESAARKNWNIVYGGAQYTLHELTIDVPDDAVDRSAIRMGIYRNEEQTTDMDAGAGNMSCGDLVDISYYLVDTPVRTADIYAAEKPVYDKYCVTTEFFYSYAEIRTFQLNGETILESSKGDPLETDTENHDDRWDAWGYREKLQYVQKLKRGQQNPFEFTAERHIDYEWCDQLYRAIIYVDWNGDNDFNDEGEEIMNDPWLAEWTEVSTPARFLGYLTPPADAAPAGRIRFGVYQHTQGYVKDGCGGAQNSDFIDILYELED